MALDPPLNHQNTHKTAGKWQNARKPTRKNAVDNSSQKKRNRF